MNTFNIDGEKIEIDISNEVFTEGYFVAIKHCTSDKDKQSRLIDESDKINPYQKKSNDWYHFKAGFIQSVR